jgi:monoamine oxidase
MATHRLLGQTVIVETSRGNFRARHVVVTLPLGYLKTHQQALFHPALPLYKQVAISQIGFGLLDKIVLRFNKPFWPMDQEGFICFHPDLPSPGFLSFVNLYIYTGEAVLLCLHAASTARKLESMTNEQVQDIMVEQLSRMFKNVTKPTQMIMTRWSHDHFAYGSYSVCYNPLGAIR